MLKLLAAGFRRIPPRGLDLASRGLVALPLPLWRRRAALHTDSLRALFGEAEVPLRSWGRAGGGDDGGASREAVRAHLLFVFETLAAIGGRRFEVDEETEGAGLPPEGSAVGEAWARRGRPASGAPGIAPGGGTPRRGCLIVTTHQGNWVIGGRYLAERYGRLDTLAGVQLHPRASGAIERCLRDAGIRIWRGSSAAARLLTRLRQGGTVVVHLDGDPDPARPRWRGRGPTRRSLGVLGAARLAARSGARILGVRCRRIAPGRFRIDSRSFPDLTPGSAPVHRVEIWEKRLDRWLRACVASAPEEWTIFASAHLGRAPEAS